MTFSSDPGCAPPRDTQDTVVIDGVEGRIRDSCGEVEATAVVGRRAYLFTLFAGDVRGPSAARRAVFDAFAATIDLRPGDALEVSSPTPS